MATPAGAKRLVLFSTATAVAVTIVSEVADGDDELFQPRVVLGGIFAAFLLLAISGPAPRISSGFALIILIGSLLSRGPEVLKQLDNRLNQ